MNTEKIVNILKGEHFNISETCAMYLPLDSDFTRGEVKTIDDTSPTRYLKSINDFKAEMEVIVNLFEEYVDEFFASECGKYRNIQEFVNTFYSGLRDFKERSRNYVLSSNANISNNDINEFTAVVHQINQLQIKFSEMCDRFAKYCHTVNTIKSINKMEIDDSTSVSEMIKRLITVIDNLNTVVDEHTVWKFPKDMLTDFIEACEINMKNATDFIDLSKAVPDDVEESTLKELISVRNKIAISLFQMKQFMNPPA